MFGTNIYDSIWDQELQRRLKAGERGLKANRERLSVAVPPADAFGILPASSTKEFQRLHVAGLKLMQEGKLGVLHLNGGLATRFGQIKATHPVGAFDGKTRTFLELKIGHVRWACRNYNAGIAYGLMNSPMTAPVTQKFLEQNKGFGLREKDLITFDQCVLRRKVPRQEDIEEYFSLIGYGNEVQTTSSQLQPDKMSLRGAKRRSTLPLKTIHSTQCEPAEGGLNPESLTRLLRPCGPRNGSFYTHDREGEFLDGSNCWAPAGHFDAMAALVLSRAIAKFVDAGAQYLQISNIDNLVATIEPAILGLLAQGTRDVLVEVAMKKPGDKGGVPVFWNHKGVILLEEFALPKELDASRIRQFNTATYWIKLDRILRIFGLDANALRKVSDAQLLEKVRAVRRMIPAYCVLRKVKISDGQEILAIQDEQLLGDITRLYLEDAGQSPHYLLIDTEKRFIPIKTKEDLLQKQSRIQEALRGKLLLMT